jgi:hypothetical protein
MQSCGLRNACWSLGAIVALALLPGTSFAASGDLVFCSKLPDKTERIHCYDAAARIAESAKVAPRAIRSTPQSTPPTDAMARAGSAVVQKAPAIVELNRFAGWHGAIGGSYGIASSHNAFVNGLVSSLHQAVNPSGAAVVGSIGYNVPHGSWIFGIELAGRWGGEEDSLQRSILIPAFATGFGDLQTYQQYQYKNEGGVQLAGRVGMSFADTMLFAKLGVGAARLTHQFVLNQTPQTPLQFSLLPLASWASTAIWTPTYVAGLGIEQNFGRVFIRLSGEMEYMNPQVTDGINVSGGFAGSATANEPIWTARGLAMIGARL